MIALCSKIYCCYDEQSDTVKLFSKGLNKNNIEESLAKFRKVLFDEEQVYSTNRGLRVVDNMKVFTYELKKVGLWYFYPLIPSVKSVKTQFTLLHYIYNSSSLDFVNF